MGLRHVTHVTGVSADQPVVASLPPTLFCVTRRNIVVSTESEGLVTLADHADVDAS